MTECHRIGTQHSTQPPESQNPLAHAASHIACRHGHPGPRHEARTAQRTCQALPTHGHPHLSPTSYTHHTRSLGNLERTRARSSSDSDNILSLTRAESLATQAWHFASCLPVVTLMPNSLFGFGSPLHMTHTACPCKPQEEGEQEGERGGSQPQAQPDSPSTQHTSTRNTEWGVCNRMATQHRDPQTQPPKRHRGTYVRGRGC